MATSWQCFSWSVVLLAPCLLGKAPTQTTRLPCSSDTPVQFAEGPPWSPWLLGPTTIHRKCNSSFASIVLASSVADTGQGGGKLNGRWWCFCGCVYYQSPWAPQMGYTEQRWLRPLGQRVCKGRTAPFPQHHADMQLIQAGRGWGKAASVHKNWEEDETSSGQEGMASRVFLSEVSACLCCSHLPCG